MAGLFGTKHQVKIGKNSQRAQELFRSGMQSHDPRFVELTMTSWRNLYGDDSQYHKLANHLFRLTHDSAPKEDE